MKSSVDWPKPTRRRTPSSVQKKMTGAANSSRSLRTRGAAGFRRTGPDTGLEAEKTIVGRARVQIRASRNERTKPKFTRDWNAYEAQMCADICNPQLPETDRRPLIMTGSPASMSSHPPRTFFLSNQALPQHI